MRCVMFYENHFTKINLLKDLSKSKTKKKNKDKSIICSLNNSIHINTDSRCVGVIYDKYLTSTFQGFLLKFMYKYRF